MRGHTRLARAVRQITTMTGNLLDTASSLRAALDAPDGPREPTLTESPRD
jgi:hypothetical protein